MASPAGVEELARGLHELGVALVASGGTSAKIRSLRLPVHDVADLTQAPEMLGGVPRRARPEGRWRRGGTKAAWMGRCEWVTHRGHQAAFQIERPPPRGLGLWGSSHQAWVWVEPNFEKKMPECCKNVFFEGFYFLRYP